MNERFKGIMIGVILTLTVTMAIPVLANVVNRNISVQYRNLRISVNGTVVPTEQEPFIHNGRTFLAVRDVANALGVEINFNDAASMIEITSQAIGSPNIVTPPAAPAPAPPAAAPPAGGSATDRNQRPANPTITRERAEQIAIDWLAARGTTGTRRGGATEMDFERGRWTWEVDRETGTHYWDIYVDVMTGDVVHYNTGRD